jgi:hypothetical protein
VAKAGPGLRFNEHIEGDGRTVFAHACKMGPDGIVSKRKDSPYRALPGSRASACGVTDLIDRITNPSQNNVVALRVLPMANDEHVAILKKGVAAWNKWRGENPDIRPDLSGVDLSGVDLNWAKLHAANLSGANLSEATFSGANLSWADLNWAKLCEATFGGADLTSATLRGANLRGAYLIRARLYEAHLSGATLSRAKLLEANLYGANLSGADLQRADLSAASLSEAKLYKANLTGTCLQRATLVDTDLTGADLTGCRIYGASAWNLKLEGTKQQDLVITPEDEPAVTVDNIEVAQFIYLMLNNQKVRDVIDTITSKVVLILGRFTPVRKPMLDALRDELRKPGRGYVPVVFDFEKSRSQTTVETVTLLARMARFVIADLSDAKSVLQELQAIVPNSPKLAVQPVIISAQEEPGMFDSIEIYRSVAKTYRYDDLAQLTANLDKWVIRPAEAKVSELRGS